MLLITAVSLLLLINFSPVTASPQAVTVPSAPIPESKDYATLAWGDPWDMSEYSDVSQYINESGRRDAVRNIEVSNGIFSATSAGSHETAQNGWFHVLFPGYQTTIHAGKAGSFHPISSSEYSCLHIAMNVNPGGDFRIIWFSDDRLVSSTWGLRYGLSAPSNMWKLHTIDLNSAPSLYAAWNSNPTWQGLRIDPTMWGDVDYSIDWVRLTDCAPQTTNITFSPDNDITSVWLRPEGTTRYIQVATNVNGSSGSYNLDTQGIQPGKYYVGFGNGNSCCETESTNTITINQTPIVHFASPTFYSGQDYATTAGNAWDMSTTEDFTDVSCSTYGLDSGVLWLNTPSNTLLSGECVGAPPLSVADPKVLLNTPVPANPAKYRYLTFRTKEENPWQYVADGSITRWIWVVPGSKPDSECYLVGNDIANDVGWHTYTIDLWDAFAGSAEAKAGNCSGLPANWQQSSSIIQMRFDPNENITDHTFRNEIDWIRLTKPIVISQGQPFTIGLDKFYANDSFAVDLFYTTDPDNQPTQHPVAYYTPPEPCPPAGPYRVYLPGTMNGTSDSIDISGDKTYEWDTASVSPGEYYICAQVYDDYNQATFCSEATVTVTQ